MSEYAKSRKELGVTYYTRREWNARVRADKLKKAPKKEAQKQAERQERARAKAERRRAKAEGRAKLVGDLIRSGASASAIAQELNVSLASSRAILSALRRLFPELVPRRRGVPAYEDLKAKAERLEKKAARAQEIARLRSSGISTAEIAKKLRYSSVHSLYNDVAKLRALFPGLLPHPQDAPEAKAARLRRDKKRAKCIAQLRSTGAFEYRDRGKARDTRPPLLLGGRLQDCADFCLGSCHQA